MPLNTMTLIADDAQGKTWVDLSRVTSVNVWSGDGQSFQVLLGTSQGVLQYRLNATNGDGTYAARQDALDAVASIMS